MTTAGNPQSPLVDSPAPEYKLVELESPFVLVSLVRQITQRLREPKLTVPNTLVPAAATFFASSLLTQSLLGR